MGEARSTSGDILFLVHRGRSLCLADFEYAGVVYTIDVECTTKRVVSIDTEGPVDTPER